MAVDVIDRETGEIQEVNVTLAEAASEHIQRPAYWRRNGHSHSSVSVDEGEWDKEFDEAFLQVQSEAGPLLWAEAKNDYNDSRYVTLGALLAKIHPILVKNKLSYNQGVGKINIRIDLGGKGFLPVWTRLTHVPTGQWQRFWVEMPLIKFDAQSYGSTMTYGRRYALVSYLGLAATDDDAVLASSKPNFDPEVQGKETSGLLRAIAKCGTEIELREWNKEKAQELSGLSEEALSALRTAWQDRLNEVKSAKPTENKPPKKAKADATA